MTTALIANEGELSSIKLSHDMYTAAISAFGKLTLTNLRDLIDAAPITIHSGTFTVLDMCNELLSFCVSQTDLDELMGDIQVMIDSSSFGLPLNLIWENEYPFG